MQSCIFSSHYSSLQCHMTLQKSFQYADYETFPLINVENINVLLLSIFMVTIFLFDE